MNKILTSSLLLRRSLICSLSRAYTQVLVSNAPIIPIAPQLPFLPKTPILDKPKTLELYELPSSSIIDALITPSLRDLIIQENNEITDPKKSIEIKCSSLYKKILRQKPKKKFAMTLIHIRRRKMNKHKLKKFRRKNMTMLKKRKLKKNILKEKAFRAEILAKIKEAEDFDAEKYVMNILNTIDNAPKSISKEEILQMNLKLIIEHRSDHCFVRPQFDDPVPPHEITE